MTETDVTARLRELADSIGDFAAVDTNTIVRSARRRRRRRRALVAAAVVLVIVATFAVWPRAHHNTITVTTNPTSTVPSMTAAQLAGGEWSELPAAPLSPREGATVLWAGDEMIVWGGESAAGAGTLDDGAAYNPTTNTWHALAASPLSPRFEASAVWTGSEMIVWGGFDVVDPQHVVDDGAAYNPASDTWTRLPASPLSARGAAAAVWTGTEMVVVGGGPGLQDQGPVGPVDAAAFDPATNSWRSLPPVPVQGHASDQIVATWAGGRVVISDASVSNGGFDFFALDPATGQWTSLPKSGDAPLGVTTLVGTPSEVISPSAQHWCGAASCPVSLYPQGSRLDVASSTWRRMSPGPVDDGSGASLWTGAALLHVASSSIGGGNGVAIDPGDAALWDAATDSWTSVRPAPIGLDSLSVGVWTGHEVLFWTGSQASGGVSPIQALRFGLPSPAATTPSANTGPVVAVTASADDTTPFTVTTGPLEAPGPTSTPGTTALHTLQFTGKTSDVVSISKDGLTARGDSPGGRATILVAGPNCGVNPPEMLVCATVGTPPGIVSTTQSFYVTLSVVVDVNGVLPVSTTVVAPMTVPYSLASDPGVAHTATITLTYTIQS